MGDTLEAKIHSLLLESPERREFLKEMGLAGLALLTGCAGAQKDLKDPSKFDTKSFVSWYKRNKLYNGPNPNCKARHSPFETFQTSIQKQYTPGVAWSVPAGEVMVAAAPGEVYNRGWITGTGRPEGWYTFIGPSKGKNGLYSPFRYNYSHIGEPFVQFHQKVERGQPIAEVPREYREFAKMYFMEYDNHVDPDNYGFNHSYMNYQTGPIAQDEEYKADPGIILNKYEKQVKLFDRVNEKRIGWEKGNLNNLWHNKSGYKPSQWSPIEKFRFLETLYQMHPHQFPNLSKEEFENIRKEFYQNQPIILTLPFKKSGLR